MATAGRILIIPKGAWGSETAYEALDLVSHNGNSWLCKKTAVGIEPSVGNAEYWFKFTDNTTVDVELEEIRNSLASKADQAALDALAQSVSGELDLLKDKHGSEDISGIANGTVTGSIVYLNSLIKIQAVDELPANPDKNTLYVIREEE